MEDDCWVGWGEVGHQHWWRMTDGRGGVNLTASRRGRPLGGEGWRLTARRGGSGL